MTSDKEFQIDITVAESNGTTEEQLTQLNRRRMIKTAGIFLGAGTALAALAAPANATSEGEGLGPDEIRGLWHSVISAADNSFPPFQVLELWGSGLWIGSGQPDLTPGALSSSLWAVYKRVGPRTFNAGGRFWTYDPNANPTGFATVTEVATVSPEGKTYHGVGYAQFFDVNGNPLGPPTKQFDDATRVA